MLFQHPMARCTKKTLVGLAIGLACLCGAAVASDAQEPAAEQPAAEQPAAEQPGAEQPAAEQDLTDGLLDLLTEPVAEPAGTSVPSADDAGAVQTPAAAESVPGNSANLPSATLPLDGARGLGASDLDANDLGADNSVEGEDLGAGGGNPLAEVRLGMLTAAGWLRERSEVAKTEALQRDIVARLDQLIADLNQQSPSPAPAADSQTSPPPQPPQRSAAQDASGDQAEPAQGTRSQPTSREATAAQESQTDGSGTQGEPVPNLRERERVVVDLNDPTALQRSVWGNLPDRVREQMQSRMVERFLPDYREQIEAYYRALAR